MVINGCRKNTHHTRHIHIQRDMNNNKMERLNGEIRDRESLYKENSV